MGAHVTAVLCWDLQIRGIEKGGEARSVWCPPKYIHTDLQHVGGGSRGPACLGRPLCNADSCCVILGFFGGGSVGPDF